MKNNRDLENEILEIKKLMERAANKDIKPLLKAYKKALDELRAELGNIYMRYSNSEGLNMTTNDKLQELRKVENSLVKMAKNINPLEVAIAEGILTNVFKDSYYRTAYTIDKGVSITTNFKILRPEFIDVVVNANFEGQNFSSRIWKNKDWLVNKLYSNIERAIKEGTKIDKLAKDIKDTFGSSAYQSKRLIHTELARVQSNAQDQIYRDSGLVSKVLYIATLDMTTNPEDAADDGKIFGIDDPNRPSIPRHPNCRCTYAPYMPNWSPKTRRDNITKENIPYQNYSDWAKSKGIS
ncbi:SPP1 gp7 family putative phage head morphogenesis protein [Brassicibacter mesophilus]